MLQYSRHAVQQMIERKISKEEVEAICCDHHTCYADKQGNPIYVGDVNSRRIKVVVAKDNPDFVITAAD